MPNEAVLEMFIPIALFGALVLIVWIGVHPNTFLGPMEASVRLLLAR